MKKVAQLLLLIAFALPAAAYAQQDGSAPPPEPQQPRPAMPGGPGGPGGMMGPGEMMFHGREHAFGTWWKDSEIAKQLELTPDQIKQIEQKFLDSRLKLIDERADLEKQETLLQSMMDEDRPDEARVGAQLDKVVAARGRLEKENAMMMLSIRRVLSVDQWKKLQTLQHEHERMVPGGMRHPGGPGSMETPGRRPGPAPTRRPDGQNEPDGPGR